MSIDLIWINMCIWIWPMFTKIHAYNSNSNYYPTSGSRNRSNHASNESTTNSLPPSKPVFSPEEVGSIPRHSQLFPNRGRHHQTDWSSHPSPARLCWISLPSDRNQNPQPREGPQHEYLQSVDGDLFSPVESPSRTSHTHNSFIASFHSIGMHTTFAFIFESIKHLMHHDMA